MKTRGLKKTKVNIVTLGCSKNLVDSEVLLTQLRGNGIEVTHESKKDDFNVVVINTCGFIDNAKQESIDTILRYVDAKEEGFDDEEGDDGDDGGDESLGDHFFTSRNACWASPKRASRTFRT